MNLSFTEPVCSGGIVLPLPRGYHQLRFVMKVSFFYICLMIASLELLASTGNGQNLDQLKVTVELNHENLSALFQQIRAQTGLTFAFLPDDVAVYGDITVPKGTRSVKAVLDMALAGTGLRYEQMENNVVVFRGRSEENDKGAASVAELGVFLIQGTVKDNKGLAMPGVNVVVKGTTMGTSTDSDGRFVIDAKEHDVLVFSFIGYKPFEMQVGGRTAIDVVMEDDVESLQEVVVNAGYYQTTDRMKTGSITRVSAKEIETQPVTSPLMALQGRMPGVDVTPANGVPGSAVKIQIRGQNSLRTGVGGTVNGNLPLYIVDGVPLDSRPLLPASTSLVSTGFDPLSTINPSNIESIEILKDADATAIYGSRGANGVVLITTKSSNKSGKTTLEVNAYKGVGSVPNRIKLLNTEQYLQMRKEAFANDNALPGNGFTTDYDLLNWDSTRYTDWQKVLLGGTSQITDIQTGISGSNSNTSFRLGGGFHSESLVFPGDFGYRRATGSFNLNHMSVNRKFRVVLSANYGSDNNKLFDDSNVMAAALTLAPNAPSLYDTEGNLNWENSTFDNPLARLKKTHDSSVDNLLVNSNLSYDLFAGLTFKLNLGYTDLDGTEFAKYPISSYDPAYAVYYEGSTYSGVNKRKSWIIEPQVSYSKEWGNNDINLVVGSTLQSSTYKSQLISANGYSSDALLGNIRGATSVVFDRDENTEYKYMAVFARLGYNHKGKYLINLTGRRDGSSRFGPDNRFANFGAIGAAWVFSNEDVITENLSFLSFGKLRASYGITGNDQIGDYKFYNTYSLTLRPYQDAASLFPTALYNPDYAWEVTKKLEAAIELGFWNNRISFECDYYRNRSSNQLIDYTLPYTTGFASVNSNLDATVENSGVELILRAENIQTANFKWLTSVNFSVPKNKLIKFPGLEESPYASQYVEGKPISIVKLYTLTGVNKETGLYEFKDENTDGRINDLDKKFITNLARDFYGGVNNTVLYKNFELSFLVQFSSQYGQNYNPSLPGGQGNQPVDVEARWRAGGDVTNTQLFSQNMFGDAATTYGLFGGSNATVSRTSFVRLKTVSLSYDFSSGVLSRINVQGLRMFAQVQNLLTITDYSGLDPETGSALPPLRMFTLGMQMKF